MSDERKKLERIGSEQRAHLQKKLRALESAKRSAEKHIAITKAKIEAVDEMMTATRRASP